jgi:hypothetical protein
MINYDQGLHIGMPQSSLGNGPLACIGVERQPSKWPIRCAGKTHRIIKLITVKRKADFAGRDNTWS